VRSLFGGKAGNDSMIPTTFYVFLTRLISPLSHSFTRLDSSQPFSLSKMADRKTRGIFVLRLPNTQLNTPSLWSNSLFMIIYCFYCLFLFFFFALDKKKLKGVRASLEKRVIMTIVFFPSEPSKVLFEDRTWLK